MKFSKIFFVALICCGTTGVLKAKGPSTSAGSILVETPGARAAALGETGSTLSNDITGMAYNPSTLRYLEKPQLSFSYQRGLMDDAFGQVMVGLPSRTGSLGVSLGYYDGGDVDIVSGGLRTSLNAQKDYVTSVGYAWNVRKVALGVAGKYVSSEIVETDKATAFAADAGLSLPLHSRIRFALALQNIGTKLNYIKVGQKMPETARAGLSLLLLDGPLAATLSLEAPYLLNEEKLTPAAGLEMEMGPLALRSGYKTGSEIEGLSFGAGIKLGQFQFDYSLGLASEFDSRQRVSVKIHFGGNENAIAGAAVESKSSADEQQAASISLLAENEKKGE